MRAVVFVRCGDQVCPTLEPSCSEPWWARGGGGGRVEAAAAWPSLLCVFWCWRLIRCDSKRAGHRNTERWRVGGVKGRQIGSEGGGKVVVVIEENGWKVNICWELKCHGAQRRAQPHASKDTEIIFSWWNVCVHIDEGFEVMASSLWRHVWTRSGVGAVCVRLLSVNLCASFWSACDTSCELYLWPWLAYQRLASLTQSL